MSCDFSLEPGVPGWEAGRCGEETEGEEEGTRGHAQGHGRQAEGGHRQVEHKQGETTQTEDRSRR